MDAEARGSGSETETEIARQEVAVTKAARKRK